MIAQAEFDSSVVSVIDLSTTEMLTDSGRYFHGLVKGLLDCEHGVYVVRKLWVVSELQKKKYSKDLIETGKVNFIDKQMLLKNSKQVDYLWCDMTNDGNVADTFKKRLNLRISARPLERAVWMPYQAHPEVSNLPVHDDASLGKARRLGVFFIGNVVPAYESDFVKSHDVMTRIHVLATLVDRFPDASRYRVFGGSSDQHGESRDKLFLPYYDAKKRVSEGKIPSDQYIGILGEIDFVICTPGTYMPFAHNVIEAMSQGCIPILQYGEYFNPKLCDGINCLSFSDEEFLELAVTRAIEMDDSQRRIMRYEVVKYYNEHLKFNSFIRKIDEVENTVNVFYYG